MGPRCTACVVVLVSTPTCTSESPASDASASTDTGPPITESTSSGTVADATSETTTSTTVSSSSAAESSDDETTTSAAGSSSDDGSTTGPAALPKFVGNITTNGQVRDDFDTYWNQITPENEGKWGSVEGVRDQMNWGPVDAIYDYAMEHDVIFKQHNFVWGSQQPNWIAGLSGDEQAEEVEEWISEFCTRYPETALIDVVNEPPPHTTPPYADGIGGTGNSGYDWIIWTFQKARQHCPNAILVLNDYNVLSWNTDQYVSIVNAVKDSGYIDAMGEQAHGLENWAIGDLENNLATVLATGLPLYITEYDVDIEDDEQQRDVMAEQFTLFWETEEIQGITLWGYVYGSTWVPSSGLIRDGQPRPALDWLMGYLDEQQRW